MKDTIDIAELKRLQADTESTTDIVSVVQARMRRDKAAGHALPDLLAAAEENARLRAENERLLGLMWYAWHEANSIRACSGSPLNYDGMRTTTDEYWDELTEAFRAALPEQDQKPWPSANARAALGAPKTTDNGGCL